MILTYQIQEDCSLRSFLENLLITGKLLAAIKTKGDLRINGEHVTIRASLKYGDQLEVIFPKEERGKQMDSIAMELDIVYEDEYLLVINKPKNIACIPDHRYSITLANGILHYYDTIGLPSTVHFVNRLDAPTSGLLIIAKYRYIHHLLSFEHIHRKYKAVVDGKVKEDLMIEKKIGRIGLNVKRCIDENGKYALTKVKVLEYFDQYTLVECTLFTGRTHQIRVHMSSIGHPLSGDTLYDSISDRPYYLHSYYLELIHPITKKQIIIEKERDWH